MASALCLILRSPSCAVFVVAYKLCFVASDLVYYGSFLQRNRLQLHILRILDHPNLETPRYMCRSLLSSLTLASFAQTRRVSAVLIG